MKLKNGSLMQGEDRNKSRQIVICPTEEGGEKMNYISLGYFCSVASELEKLGLRKESSPFDWLISDFEGVIMAITNHFEDYLNLEFLSQNIKHPEYYKNTKYNFEFYHDFDKYKPLDEQLPKVVEKYNRRIKRFYESISGPTLFVRYISDEKKTDNKSNELIYIENNYEQILKLIKSFNNQNEILFVANDGVNSSKIKIYNVSKDKKDTVARKFLCKNEELFNILNNAYVPNKKVNVEKYKKKARYGFFKKYKIKSIIKSIFLKKYKHYKLY